MNEMELHEKVVDIDSRSKSNTKRIDALEERQIKNENIINSLDKSLSVTIEQIKNIAEDLKTTSVNFKEAVMRSNTANSKETQLLKEKYIELDKKIEKLDLKISQETVVKDAEKWRATSKHIWSWVLNAILLIIAAALGISKFL